MSLSIRQARTLRDFLAIRKIRNSCVMYIPGHIKYIGWIGQVLFYLKYHASDKFKVLYIGEDKDHNSIAYGLISYDRELRPWVAGGILAGYRGKGYGEQLFKFLSDSSLVDVYLEVLESNLRARNLYTKLGFQEVGREEKLSTHKQEPRYIETVITMKKAQ